MRRSLAFALTGLCAGALSLPAQEPQPAPVPAPPPAPMPMHPMPGHQVPGQPMPMHQAHMQMMQDQSQLPPKFAWFVTLGGGRFDWGDVTAAFNAAGYSAPADNAFQIGGGGYGVTHRFLIGGEGYGYAGSDVGSSGGRQVRAEGGTFFFNLGYAVVEQRKLRAYPFVGVGGTMASFRVQQATGTGLGPQNNNPSFQQVLTAPGHKSMLTASGLAIELGAGVDFVPFQRHRPKGWYGLLLGIRAGYQFVPVRSDWRLFNTVDVTGGPDDIGNAFFVRVSIGGAGRKHAPGMGGGCPMMQGEGGMACPMHQGMQGMQGHDH